MSGGGGSSSGDQNSTYTPAQSEDFNKYLGEIWAGYGEEGNFYDPEYAGGQDTLAGWSPEQEALFDRLAGGGGAIDKSVTALEQSLGPYDPNNPTLTAAIDASTSDIYRGLNEQALPGIATNAVGAGQFGSSRQGIAEGIAARGAVEQAGDVASQMRYNDMLQYQTNQQQNLANIGNITSAIEFAGGGQQRQDQAQMDDNLARWEYESSSNLRDLQALRDLLNVNMGGVSEGTSEQSSGGGK